MAGDLEKRLNDQKKVEAEKKARDRRKRMMARANARAFERENPRLVEKGLTGKSALMDNGKVWGISENKKKLMDYYRQVHGKGFDEEFPLMYEINEKDAQRYLAEEQERQKTKRARARREKRLAEPAEKPEPIKPERHYKTKKAGEEEKPERKYSHSTTAKTPRNERPYHAKSSQTSERPDDKSRKLPETDNRNVYKPVSLRSSNNISYKMADKKPEKKPEKKEEKKPEKKPEAKKPQERILPNVKECEGGIAAFRGIYEDYMGSKPCHEAVMNFGNLKSNPGVYNNLEAKIAQWAVENKVAEDLFPRPRNDDGTPAKYDETTLGKAAEYWYKTSKKKTAETFDSNLEKIALGMDYEPLRAFIANAPAPSKYDEARVKDLADAHKKYHELNSLFFAVEHSEDAGVKQAALKKLQETGYKLFEEKMEKQKVDKELRPIFRDIFGYHAVELTAKERDSRYKAFKEQLDKTIKPELSDYFVGIAKDMSKSDQGRETLYQHVYGATMPKEKKETPRVM